MNGPRAKSVLRRERNAAEGHGKDGKARKTLRDTNGAYEKTPLKTEKAKDTLCGANGARREDTEIMEEERTEERAERPSVDVIIPVYKPDRRFARLLRMLARQTYPVNRIIIMNTESRYWKDEAYEGIRNLEIHHLTKEEFDHGGTRNRGAGYGAGDVMLFMTDDAVPQDNRLVERLVAALKRKGPAGETAAAAYARQLPEKDCNAIERFTRNFNYPDKSRVKTRADLPELGIKTYFASNVCCAYRRDIFEGLGGFAERTIFNEDMIYAAGAVAAGYAVVYAADAKVIHSHNLTLAQQFRRNFDLGVSQADHPEVFGGVSSEGEGVRLVKQTAAWLVRGGKLLLVPSLLAGSGCKWIGYRLGKRYRSLPRGLVLRCTDNREYWERETGRNG